MLQDLLELRGVEQFGLKRSVEINIFDGGQKRGFAFVRPAPVEQHENVVLVIIVVVVILFGAKRLPEFARGFARARYEFEKARKDVREEIGSLDNTKLSNRRDQLESLASKLDIEDVSSLSDDELQKKILESINRDNERHTTF